MCARSFGGRDEVRGVRGRNAADAGSNRHRDGVWYRASHLQVFGLPADRAAVDVQSRQNVRHSSARRRDPAQSARHRGADRQRCPSKRLGASDREAQQHTEGAQGTNGSGNEFAASVRGQGAREQADRPARESQRRRRLRLGPTRSTSSAANKPPSSAWQESKPQLEPRSPTGPRSSTASGTVRASIPRRARHHRRQHLWCGPSRSSSERPAAASTLCLETVRHFAAALGELRHDLPV